MVRPLTSRRLRLDLALVERGLARTRAQARDLVTRGRVAVDRRVTTRPARMVDLDATFDVDSDSAAYVARSAEKLVAALDGFALSPEGRVALDIGASTGGFTQVLLARGALRVHAVDVGHDQLSHELRADPRVVVHEAVDARALDRARVPETIGAIVADVSFISLTKALPAAMALAASDAWLIALVKPQFELEPGAIGKGGIVRHAPDRARAVDRIAGFLGTATGWRVIGTIASPIAGKRGNQETLIAALRADG